jgi:hypothetical protein
MEVITDESESGSRHMILLIYNGMLPINIAYFTRTAHSSFPYPNANSVNVSIFRPYFTAEEVETQEGQILSM